MSRIAVFIPVRNEEQTLAELLRNIPSEIHGDEIVPVVVDDCSSDRSAEIANLFTPYVISTVNDVGVEQKKKRLRVFDNLWKNFNLKKKNQEGRGVGVTTKKGFQYVLDLGDFDFLVKLDGDGQHDPDFLPEMVEHLKKGSDVVICSRFHPLSDQTHTPRDRILLNTIFTEMVRKITSWDLTDVRSGYMGFCMGLIKKITPRMIVRGYGVPMEILIRAWNEKPEAKITEIPHPAIYGGKISLKLQTKYKEERIKDQALRVQQAYAALLEVIEDLNIPQEKILRVNGFKKYRDVAIGIK